MWSTRTGLSIVDSFTGRLMPGRRYSDGLHQAIEAKEGVQIQKENKTLATITFQNYFRMYGKLSGMTGTALTEEDEFREIYKLDVIEIPTNKPMIRDDHPDAVYRTMRGKYNAIVEQVRECHAKGQPVLVGPISIDKSEELSKMLRDAGIPHTVLNAKYHAKEAAIVAQAGQLGAVTISTNMAGRGTDILLGGNPEFMAKEEMRAKGISEEYIARCTGMTDTDDEELIAARKLFRELTEKHRAKIEPEAEKVKAAGGLFILGTERHESRRIDNQLRGRSGRQGDPGESKFFLSMEDDLMRLFGTDRFQGIVEALKMPEDMPIDAKILSNAIERAQKRIEAANFKRRKYVLSYDDVMNQQRTLIYNQRRQVLDGENISPTIQRMISETVADTVHFFTGGDAPAHEWNLEGLRAHFLGWLTTEDDFRFDGDELKTLTREELTERLTNRALDRYHEKEALFGEEVFREVERAILLRNVDSAWMEHIDTMEDLKNNVGLQAYAQRDPVTEYRIRGAEMFDGMVEDIRKNTVRMILTVVPRPQETIRRVQIAKPITEGFEGGEKKRPVVKKNTPAAAKETVGRNDPCPCGSGKKYKNCCMRGNSQERQ